MGVFWCARHERMEDADEVGYVESHDGEAVCQAAQDEAEEEAYEWGHLTLKQKRHAMGGEFGGDGRDD